MVDDVRWLAAPDGTRIAYTVAGQPDGRPTLLLTNGLTTTTAFWKYLAAAWQRDYRVIRWDLPGHGLSDPPVTPGCMNIEAQPAIMKRIMQAEGVTRAVQIGFSVGCQIVLEMARQEPAMCSALVLLLGAGGRVFDTLRLPIRRAGLELLLRTPPRLFRFWYQAMAQTAQLPLSIPISRQLGLVGKQASDADLRELVAHLCRLEPVAIQRMAGSAARHTALDLLPRLTLPLFIVGGGKDLFAPLDTVARKLHTLAPRSQLLVLPDGTHTAMLDAPQPIITGVQQFLAAALAV